MQAAIYPISLQPHGYLKLSLHTIERVLAGTLQQHTTFALRRIIWQ